ncbi:MAG: LacI family transcriptional regulator [Actinobacteria bacterium]|nr:LacI family transcriptional regulator [Cyanobacteriota bacterium]MCL5771115.1 LacI family transcriptional regulator [Actinomycetota bacterium]
MITIKDVAKKAGVSVGTVSNVINNIDIVSESTKRKVFKAIKELNFKPNIIARSLSKGKTDNIAIIVPEINNPFFPELIRGITDFLETKGYYAIIINTDNNAEKEEIFINGLNSFLVSGIIIAPADSKGKDFRVLSELKIPIVIVDRESDNLNDDTVIVNNHKGAYDAVNYLINCGHKIIIILCGSNHTKTAQNRYIGWRKAMEENNLFNDDYIYWGDFTIDSGYKMMDEVLKKFKKVDAVFASNDIIAIGAMQAIRENGLRIPEDISIIGFDDIYFSKLLSPPLTTIRQPVYEIGSMAAEILLKKIEGKSELKNICRYVIDGELIIRDSVAKKAGS